MLINNCEQGTIDWLMARLAIPTSSNFKKIVTPTKLGLSAQSVPYQDKLLAEYILQEPTIYYEDKNMEDGTEREPRARELYSIITGQDVEEVGLVYLDESKTVSCSPDGLIKKEGEWFKGIEIKCPKLSTQIKRVREGILPSDYLLQVQGSMWVTGLNEWDFMSYHPNYKPLLLTIKRDGNIISKLSEAVLQFSADLEALKKEVLESGYKVEVA